MQFPPLARWIGDGVKKASEYRAHAAECRKLAGSMGRGEAYDQLMEMAATWDRLAKDRAELIERHPELAEMGERSEETGSFWGRYPRSRELNRAGSGEGRM